MMPMGFEAAAVLISAIAALVAIAAFIRAGQRVDKGEAVKLEARLATLEATVNAMPTRQAVHDLALSIEHLAGEVKELRSDHKGLRDLHERQERIIERQEEFLLKVRGTG